MVIGGDELSYAYAGQHSSHIENPARVTSFADIVNQQIGDYNFRGNGRILIHSTIAVLSWHHLLIPYRIATVFVWFLFVWLVLKAANVKPLTAGKYLCGFAFVYWFFWYGEIAGCNACFSGNYLWPACLTILMMGLWRGRATWWLIPASILFGLMQETFTLPFLGSVFLSSAYRYVFQRQRRFNWIKISSWILMLIGACFLCFGPASRARAAQVAGSFGAATASGLVHAFLVGTPLLLLGLVVFVWFRRRKEWRAWLEGDLEWILFFICSFGLWVLVVKDVYLRTCAAWFMSAMIIVIRNRAIFTLSSGLRRALVAFVFVWMIVAAVAQAVIGIRSYRMVDLYEADPQGVTKYDNLPSGPFFYTCNDSCLIGWHLKFYRLEAGREVGPIVLPSSVYETLYLKTDEFFRTAPEIGLGLYIDRQHTGVVIARGKGMLSPEQEKIRADYFASNHLSAFWQVVPGRFRLMYHPEGSQFVLPRSPFTIKTKTGEEVTLWTK